MQKTGTFLLTFLIMIFLCSRCIHPADIAPYAHLLDVIEKSFLDISKGGSRQDAVAAIHEAIKGLDDPSFKKSVKEAYQVVADLEMSIEKEKSLSFEPSDIQQKPVAYLMETKFPKHLIDYKANNKFLAKTTKEKLYENDPVVFLLEQGHKAVPLLIDSLAERSVTRYYSGLESFTSMTRRFPRIPRVCDYAIALIEYFTRCRFHFFKPHKGKLDFHQLSDSERDETIAHIKEWWEKNKDKPVLEGVKAQIPYAGFYEKIEMAENLIELGDKAYGVQILRNMVLNNTGTEEDYMFTSPANALAKFGDFSVMDYLFKKAKKGKKGSSEFAWYFMRHGKRREWELLYAISKGEIEAGKEADYSGILGSVVGFISDDYHSQSRLAYERISHIRYGIPILALALIKTENKGSRWLSEQVPSQSFSDADVAGEMLQELTGKDFGYRKEGTEEERLTAIKKMRKWWCQEGQSKFTYGKIEKMEKGI